MSDPVSEGNAALRLQYPKSFMERALKFHRAGTSKKNKRPGLGVCTKEVTEPGFHHNLHSINHFHINETPWFKDLSLGERVTYITPRYEFGQARHATETGRRYARLRPAMCRSIWHLNAHQRAS